jgi:ribosome-binding protein aMBF1 (putative translation factor)
MVAFQAKMGASKQGAKRVGKKRSAQPKEVARTMSGKFGARLEELATKAGLSPDDLAEKLGKSPGIIRYYYVGRSVPHIDDWPLIAKVLGVTIHDLLPR